MQKLNIEYPPRDERVGTVEVGVKINGNEYYTYMVPGACNLRSLYGLNNISERGAHPQHILAALVLAGIGGSLLVLTDAYTNGEDARLFKDFVETNQLGRVTLTSADTRNPYTGNVVVGAMFEYDLSKLKKWYDAAFGEAENDGWIAPSRVNMDDIFYQYGGRPHAKNPGDDEMHKYLNATLERSREALASKKSA